MRTIDKRGRYKKTPIEQFDPTTLWPVAIYPGVSDPFGGPHITAIKLALNGLTPTAAGYGWRTADAVSRLPEFVAECCIEQPDAPIDFKAMGDRLQEWAGQPGDVARLRALIESRYGWSGLMLRPVPVDALAAYIASHVDYVKDSEISFEKFHAGFIESLPKDDRDEWTRVRVLRAIPWKHRGKQCLSNAAWRPIEAPPAPPGDRLAAFVAEQLHDAPGHLIAFSDFYERFQKWLPRNEWAEWSKIKTSRAIPFKFRTGKGTANNIFLTNAAWGPCEPGPAYVVTAEGKIRRPDPA